MSANAQHVSASAQSQALAALLFLYVRVLLVPLARPGEFTRAKRSQRVPVVLAQIEIGARPTHCQRPSWRTRIQRRRCARSRDRGGATPAQQEIAADKRRRSVAASVWRLQLNFGTLGRREHMTPDGPDVDALVQCAVQSARAMGLPDELGYRARTLLLDVLYKPQSNGGKEAWNCYVSGLITATELRYLLMAHMATWLADQGAIPEPSSELWATTTLERGFDRALLPRHHGSEAARRDVVAAIKTMAATATDGVLLRMEADGASLRAAREMGVGDSNLEERFISAAESAAKMLPSAHWSRTSWAGFEFAVEGTSDLVATRAKEFVEHLAGSRSQKQCLDWHAILVRVLPGDPRRVLRCDPAYDLAGVQGSFVAVVEPYSGDDWQQSQRYPTVTVVWNGP